MAGRMMRAGALIIAPVLWTVCFLLLYTTESLFCTHGQGGQVHAIFALAIGGAIAALLAGLVLWFRKRAPQAAFLR